MQIMLFSPSILILLLLTPFVATLPMNSQTDQGLVVPPFKVGLDLQSRQDMSQMSPAEVERLQPFSSGYDSVGGLSKVQSPASQEIAKAIAQAVVQRESRR
ncbi:hypothetical protein QCA50_004088 [Cerrena zonata]|uniref:Uncharacterized protein n=1 Tax=Cerrena zonata TaxID=2478898 RepID=A0AAW0GQG7_9APHY